MLSATSEDLGPELDLKTLSNLVFRLRGPRLT